MRRSQNFEKTFAAHTEETLRLSFDTSFGTITFITLPKSREIINQFLVHFRPLRIFLKSRS